MRILALAAGYAAFAILALTPAEAPVASDQTTISDEQVKAIHRYARNGSPTAQALLAAMYLNGNGVDKDVKKAKNLFLKAARRGNRGAQYQMGRFYELGEFVKQDQGKAVKWYQKAADQQYRPAIQGLTRLAPELAAEYDSGPDSDPDHAVADTKRPDSAVPGQEAESSQAIAGKDADADVQVMEVRGKGLTLDAALEEIGNSEYKSRPQTGSRLNGCQPPQCRSYSCVDEKGRSTNRCEKALGQ